MGFKNYHLLNKNKSKNKGIFICFTNVFIKCFIVMFILLVLSVSNLLFENFFQTVEACINSFFDCFNGEFVSILI